ncbi:AAA family ATPase [Mucilaginibacter pedocola]|uniref:RecF/RecN/SMC N-terminal domain-containing protein n=1 Tax=Mucilaginibacter pedocola TaxID=1792845 RepID=A0A1S9P6S6_9SPHI|nr:AAA family ATPase [Mucilaginibacter pedocola]OOQ56656.1 hypothetical protein BC343_19725 [Mucilaginibacter pedocola]
MIKVKSLKIVEFRGIRDLEIDFNSKNFAVSGRNGTGKSGIVDALEFALTGSISRLAGAGTGGISLKEHAPHVDSRKKPASSKVIVKVHLSEINKEVTIERCVSNPDEPTVVPSSPAILGAIKEVSRHPEFTLSRRELIKYVLTGPGERAKEIQALLRLEKIEQVRTLLQKIANADKRDISPLATIRDQAKQHLLTSLGLTSANTEQILKIVNENRKQLGLSELTEFNSTTSFREGLNVTKQEQQSVISKVTALANLANLRQQLKSYNEGALTDAFDEVIERIEVLNVDKELLNSLNKENFLKTALALVEDEHCPVCDTIFETLELKAIIEKKLRDLKTVANQRKEIEDELVSFKIQLDQLIYQLQQIKGYGALLIPKVEITAIEQYLVALQKKTKAIAAFLPIEDLISELGDYGSAPVELEPVIVALENGVNNIPEPSKQDAAKEFLILANEKLDAYRSAAATHKHAEEKEKRSASISKKYGDVVTSVLEQLYKDVEAKFAEYYRFINQDDESAFTAQLTASAGKLAFNVDFYGRGYFPPGAYHSEGHQDGMGLCLYLALMKHLLGDKFTFAVLDDVLMSVDSGHRREVCKLLKEKFPNTQFILTTHDSVWLKHMKTAGLIQSKSSLQFRKWDVDNGPNQWNDKDVWQEIENHLSLNDVGSAAYVLRNYLEYMATELSHRLRTRVEFRGDAQFSLGDLLPPATSQFSKLLGDGIKAAKSWQKIDLEEQLKQRKIAFDRLVTKSMVEQWQTNSSIHYNEWVNLQASEFRPVAAAFKGLMEGFSCTDIGCDSTLYVVPEKGEREMLRCSCGSVMINLKVK